MDSIEGLAARAVRQFRKQIEHQPRVPLYVVFKECGHHKDFLFGTRRTDRTPLFTSDAKLAAAFERPIAKVYAAFFNLTIAPAPKVVFERVTREETLFRQGEGWANKTEQEIAGHLLRSSKRRQQSTRRT
jgi:hypothetical protein